MKSNILSTFLFLLFSVHLLGQNGTSASDIYHKLEKLNTLGTVLYVAAHPDDENTRLISYFANEKHMDTYYLSLTRGDGGQNLIGTETGPLLGVLRTQELLAARRIDNGGQRFTRAIDFGFSKTADETIEIWDEEKVKHDVIWAVRNLKPDIIVNRFDHESNGRTHGHHTASAMLSYDLFESYGDKNVYPEQLDFVDAWQPSSLYFNTSWWFYGGKDKFEAADKSDLLGVDIGAYYPTLGISNNEIAALSRSQHKCQGFGSTGSRGTHIEYLKYLKGKKSDSKTDATSGFDFSWNRVNGGNEIGKIIESILSSYNVSNPTLILPQLVQVAKLIDKIDDPYWRTKKQIEIQEIIADCLGLYVSASTDVAFATNNEVIECYIEVTKRQSSPLILTSYDVNGAQALVLNEYIEDNQPFTKDFNIAISPKAQSSSPYWLEKEPSLGVYHVDELSQIGLPESQPSYELTFNFNIDGYDFTVKRTLKHQYNDPEKGEVQEIFNVVPKAVVNFENDVEIFSGNASKMLKVEVMANTDSISGKLALKLSPDWSVSPAYYDIENLNRGMSQYVEFEVSAPNKIDKINASIDFQSDGKSYSDELIQITYDHINNQQVVTPAISKLVSIPLKKNGKSIAYIQGSGDVIPNSLSQIGYNVTELDPEDISKKVLNKYDAVILGIRAYNKHKVLKNKQSILMDYVYDGGTLINQYNTHRNLATKELGPYPFEISRNRVTVEGAEVRFSDKEHPLLNTPNKITDEDFDNWVQERGLYFTINWDDKYDTILSMNDPGEDELQSAVLAAEYGKGKYIHTSLSLFRQLPAGVPGAYRLLANMISWGNE